MKNIFKIHPFTYIFTLIFIFIGYFKLYIFFLIILFVHEIGHILSALFFKWRIKEIIVLPMGLLLKFEDNLNKPLIEEAIIASMGIIFQLIFICFIHNKILTTCSNIIILFNLLPIFPLDGAKILNILLNKIANFKTSYFLSLFISLITILILISIFIINHALIFLIVFIPLLINLIDLFCKFNNIFIKFLLERYLYEFRFKRYKIINNLSKMKRDYNHYFYINNKLYNEKEVLNKYFNK